MILHSAVANTVTMQDAAAATGEGALLRVTSVDGTCTFGTMQVTGTFVGTVTFQATVDGTNWVSLLMTNLTTGSTSATATAPGIFRATVAGLKAVRANVTAYTSGDITVTGVASA